MTTPFNRLPIQAHCAPGSRMPWDAEGRMALAGGYDHNFVLNKVVPGAVEWWAGLSGPERGG